MPLVSTPAAMAPDKRQNSADGEINAAGQDDQRHADGKTKVHRNLAQDVPPVFGGEELVRQHCHRTDHHHERDERLKASQKFFLRGAIDCQEVSWKVKVCSAAPRS